ncbi:hypothetical protein PPSIR1_02076, partial [Plesiocystis pacifica SIR-1]
MNLQNTTLLSLSLALICLGPVGCGDDLVESNDEVGEDTDTETESTEESTESTEESTESTEESTESTESETDTTETETDTTETDTTETDTTTEETDTGETDTTGETGTEDTTEDTTEESTETGPFEPCTGQCGTPGCGTCPDTAVVDIAGIHGIDATEATVDDYSLFLDVEFDMLGFLAPECFWKVGTPEEFEPEIWDDQLQGSGQNPVTGVDWCDAEAYCRWQGKHLCGLDGGEAGTIEDSTASNNEWYRACSNGGVFTYPYGDTYSGTACNGEDLALGAVSEVGSLSGCEGGVADIFDMSGNVWEWTAACAMEPMTEDFEQQCQRRGGSWFSNSFTMRCAIESERVRTFRAANTGIRC